MFVQIQMIVNGREARILSQLTKSTRFRNHTTSGGTYSTTRYDLLPPGSRRYLLCPRRWPLAKISSRQSSLRWKGTERDGADDEQKRHVWWLPAVTMVYIATGPCLLLLLYYSTVSAAVRSCASPLFAEPFKSARSTTTTTIDDNKINKKRSSGRTAARASSSLVAFNVPFTTLISFGSSSSFS